MENKTTKRKKNAKEPKLNIENKENSEAASNMLDSTVIELFDDSMCELAETMEDLGLKSFENDTAVPNKSANLENTQNSNASMLSAVDYTDTSTIDYSLSSLDASAIKVDQESPSYEEGNESSLSNSFAFNENYNSDDPTEKIGDSDSSLLLQDNEVSQTDDLDVHDEHDLEEKSIIFDELTIGDPKSVDSVTKKRSLENDKSLLNQDEINVIKKPKLDKKYIDIMKNSMVESKCGCDGILLCNHCTDLLYAGCFFGKNVKQELIPATLYTVYKTLAIYDHYLNFLAKYKTKQMVVNKYDTKLDYILDENTIKTVVNNLNFENFQHTSHADDVNVKTLNINVESLNYSMFIHTLHNEIFQANAYSTSKEEYIWERIMCVFHYSACLIINNCSDNMNKMGSNIIDWTVTYLTEFLSRYVDQIGSWEIIFSCIKADEHVKQENAISKKLTQVCSVSIAVVLLYVFYRKFIKK